MRWFDSTYWLLKSNTKPERGLNCEPKSIERTDGVSNSD